MQALQGVECLFHDDLTTGLPILDPLVLYSTDFASLVRKDGNNNGNERERERETYVIN